MVVRPRRVGRSEPLPWRVSDELWGRLEPILADPPRRFRYPGRWRYPAAAVSGGDLVRALHRHALVAGALPGARVCPVGRDVPPAAWRSGRRRGLFAQALVVLQQQLGETGRLDWSRVIVDALVGGGEKGGRKVARTLHGRPGSRYHLPGRRKRRPARGQGGGRQRERAPSPAPAARRARSRAGSRRASCGPTAATTRDELRRAATPTRGRTADQQAPPRTGDPAPQRPDNDRLARPQTPPENTRPARPPALARSNAPTPG